MLHVCAIYISHLPYPPYPFIHWHIGYFYVLAIVNNTVIRTWECRYLFDIVILFPLDIYPEVRLLYHMVVLFNFLRNLHTVFHSSVPIYISTKSAHRFTFSTSSPALLSFYFLIIAMLTDVSLYFIVVLISISFWLGMVSIFSCTS